MRAMSRDEAITRLQVIREGAVAHLASIDEVLSQLQAEAQAEADEIQAIRDRCAYEAALKLHYEQEAKRRAVEESL